MAVLRDAPLRRVAASRALTRTRTLTLTLTLILTLTLTLTLALALQSDERTRMAITEANKPKSQVARAPNPHICNLKYRWIFR